jgi:hypothetical protein
MEHKNKNLPNSIPPSIIDYSKDTPIPRRIKPRLLTKICILLFKLFSTSRLWLVTVIPPKVLYLSHEFVLHRAEV